MTPTVRQFLTEWLIWAEDGAGDHPVFTRISGLCSTYTWWLEERDTHEDTGVWEDLDNIFAQEFTPEYDIDGMFDLYPFGGKEQYLKDCRGGGAMHTNELRLSWVRSQLSPQ